MDPVEGLFRDLDAAIAPHASARFQLRIVGSTALFAQTDWRRGTKDSDAVHTWDFNPAVHARLIALAGPGSALALRHRVYLEFVGEGLLLLPEDPLWHPWLTLAHLDVQVLDPIDVAVAKLARLHRDDLLDIEAMVERGRVSHAALVARFRSAALRYGQRGMEHKLRPAIANLHRVERDVFVTAESHIELPDWMDV